MEEYNANVAYHYQAYRPDLHLPILQSVLGTQLVATGLDIGCGTGQSALALAHFCTRVTGLEPALAMFQRAIAHPQVQYQLLEGTQLDFPDSSFQLITFAGSWFYARSQLLLDEVVRVGAKGGQVVLYDFAVLLEPILVALLPKGQQIAESDYDHQADFAGLDQSELRLEQQRQATFSLELTDEEVVHLLLSVKATGELLAANYGTNRLYEQLMQRLKQLWQRPTDWVKVKTFVRVYRIIEVV